MTEQQVAALELVKTIRNAWLKVGLLGCSGFSAIETGRILNIQKRIVVGYLREIREVVGRPVCVLRIECESAQLNTRSICKLLSDEMRRGRESTCR